MHEEAIREVKEKIRGEEIKFMECMYKHFFHESIHEQLTVDVMKKALHALNNYWPSLGALVSENQEVPKDRLVHIGTHTPIPPCLRMKTLWSH